MRQMMLAGIVPLVAAAALACTARAAEQIEPKPAKVSKAERIEKLKRDIFKAERTLETTTEDHIARFEKDGQPKLANQARRARADALAKLPGLRTELAWLEGRLALAACEKNVKTLEESLGKAGEAEKPGIEKALEVARAELALVRKLEAEKDF